VLEIDAPRDVATRLRRCLDLTDAALAVIGATCVPCTRDAGGYLDAALKGLADLLDLLGEDPSLADSAGICLYCGQTFYHESGHSCPTVVTRKTAVSHG
jgi:hypothetical protein